ncbi:MAG: gas vesicle protein K, partial [Candidatus Melainabacteria bacterium]|nr:gas vesicle protein K [Candidatus Melainabacteria bacterium]
MGNNHNGGGNDDLRCREQLATRSLHEHAVVPAIVSCGAAPCSSAPTGGDRVLLDPENLEKGLAQLVLTVIELLRQLLEKQALRRMEDGSLSDSQIERMGETFIKLKEKVEELKEVFGLSEEDL